MLETYARNVLNRISVLQIFSLVLFTMPLVKNSLAFGQQQPFKQSAGNLPLQLPDRPVGLDGFFFITAPLVRIRDGEQLSIM